MNYAITKELARALQAMTRSGAERARKARRVNEIVGGVHTSDDPLKDLPKTNHGESRIKKCIKYDLGGGHRLITIQDNGICVFAFAGNHNECDAWLDRNAGYQMVRNNNGEIDIVFKTIDLSIEATRTKSDSDVSFNLLWKRLNSGYQEKLLNLIPGAVVPSLMGLNTTSSDEDIYSISTKIEDESISTLLYDCLIALRGGSTDGTYRRIDLHLGKLTPVEDLSEGEVITIKDGEETKIVRLNSKEYAKWIENYMKKENYQDWMLFMHPKQEEIAFAEYNGPTKLSGVSGSGKTCVVVMRAIHLAKSRPDKPVLVLTLNKSLAALIDELLDYACPDKNIRKIIKCKSFFSLCQKKLIEMHPENEKLYTDITWKTNTHIDEVWREYYRCECNNDAADVLLPLHKSLNKQKIIAEKYIRQEFDWIRSVFGKDNYSNYYDIERVGRAIPLSKDQREDVLNGLGFWEEKMKWVGVVDPIGLSAALAKDINKLVPEYSSVLIDEAQDFGTVELQIIRALVANGQNDLFFAGDMTQHIMPKHQSFIEAGVSIPGARSLTIQKNYRNGREILKAAYELIMNNSDLDYIFDGELDILDPEYANFSSPVPCAMKADNLSDEIAFALTLAKQHLDNNPHQRACIAICGYSLFEISNLAHKAGISVLDGTAGLSDDMVFMADLEQTKGYEFDLMLILNCSEHVMPSFDTPPEEYFRDACKLYVAMTRAKNELYISYNGAVTPWISNEKCKDCFDFADWDELVSVDNKNRIGAPAHLPRNIDNPTLSVMNFTGKQFLRTRYALGLSLPLQDKIEKLIAGQTVRRGHLRYQWKNIHDAYEDVKHYPHAQNQFGGKAWKDFVECVDGVYG